MPRMGICLAHSRSLGQCSHIRMASLCPYLANSLRSLGFKTLCSHRVTPCLGNGPLSLLIERPHFQRHLQKDLAAAPSSLQYRFPRLLDAPWHCVLRGHRPSWSVAASEAMEALATVSLMASVPSATALSEMVSVRAELWVGIWCKLGASSSLESSGVTSGTASRDNALENRRWPQR